MGDAAGMSSSCAVLVATGMRLRVRFESCGLVAKQLVDQLLEEAAVVLPDLAWETLLVFVHIQR